MYQALQIVDDFINPEEALRLRRKVLEQGFKTFYYEDPPVPYHTVNVELKADAIIKAIGDLTGHKVDLCIQAFRLGAEKSQLHNLVHADHTCAAWAAVYYLNPEHQCQGGTAFWRHKKHGWCAMPTQQEIENAGYTLEQLAADWHIQDAWEMVSLAGMRHNRIIIYPSQIFHSRWPWSGFGQEPDQARLVHVSFFNLT